LRGPLRCEFFAIPAGLCGKVLPEALCTWLADVELSTDRPNGRDAIFRKLLCKQFGRLFQ
jgi:hypothetical protein